MNKIARRRPAAVGLAADLALAPLVVAMRMPGIAADLANGAPMRAESVRAVTEKAAAVAEGLAAAQMSLMRSAFSFWPEVMTGRVPSLLSGEALEKSMQAALVPAGRKVRANYRRLSGR